MGSSLDDVCAPLSAMRQATIAVAIRTAESGIVEAVRTLLIRAAIIAAGIAIAWLFAGRRISLVLDRVMTVRFATLPTSPLVYDDSFRIGELSMDTTGPTGNPSI